MQHLRPTSIAAWAPAFAGATLAPARRLLGGAPLGLRRAGLAVVFTDPEIAIVGGGWRDAQPVPHVTGAVSFHNQGRSRVMLRNKGLLHVYVAIEDGAFLGAEMLGPDAEHIGHLLAWALQMKLTVQQMLDMPFYHPVIEEGVRTALRDARAKLAVAQAERRAA